MFGKDGSMFYHSVVIKYSGINCKQLLIVKNMKMCFGDIVFFLK